MDAAILLEFTVTHVVVVRPAVFVVVGSWKSIRLLNSLGLNGFKIPPGVDNCEQD